MIEYYGIIKHSPFASRKLDDSEMVNSSAENWCAVLDFPRTGAFKLHYHNKVIVRDLSLGLIPSHINDCVVQ